MYLRNWTARTVGTYRQGLAALDAVVRGGQISPAALQSFVITMSEVGCTEGHISDRCDQVAAESGKTYMTLTDGDIRRFATYTPKRWASTVRGLDLKINIGCGPWAWLRNAVELENYREVN